MLQRAAELEAQSAGPEPLEGFDLRTVEEAAREVGLSPAAVHLALAELRSRPAQGTVKGTRHRRLGGPGSLVEARLCTAEAELVHATADEFFARQTFELRRRQGTTAVYRQRRDVVARIRRGVDFMGEIQLDGVESVRLMVSPIGAVAAPDDVLDGSAGPEPQCMVRIEATLKPGRRAVMTGAAGTGAAVTGLSGATALVTGEPTWLLAGGSVGLALGGIGLGLRRRWQRRHVEEATEVLATLLDVLEDPSTGD